MLVQRLLRRFCLLNIVDDSGGGGGNPLPMEPTPTEPTPPAPPASMLDAMFGQQKPADPPIDAEAPAGQPRDELGRFAPKTADGAPAVAATAPAVQPPASPPAQPAAQQPPRPEDDLAAPEGLSPKAQQRFQALANEVKELRPLRERAEQLDQQVGYIRESFQEHGVQQEQFEQAVSVIGMINRGDFAGAQRVLLEQLQHLSILSGQPVQQVDALATFPDLREAVNGLQITEAHALELARSRRTQQLMQERHQQQEQVQQTQQQEQQAVRQGQMAVDRLCKQLAAADLDFPAIEAKLLPMIGPLLQGVPPSMWADKVKTQYDLIKSVAVSQRAAAPAPAATVLRPTGQSSPGTAPRSMHEAMWGKPAGA